MTDPTTPEGETETDPQTYTGPTDDGGAALDRVEEAIDDARDAGASVAANDDVPVLDDERAGQFSESQDGQGDAPAS